jgi:hypothetical protein
MEIMKKTLTDTIELRFSFVERNAENEKQRVTGKFAELSKYIYSKMD